MLLIYNFLLKKIFFTEYVNQHILNHKKSLDYQEICGISQSYTER